jgi:hypothetical protein
MRDRIRVETGPDHERAIEVGRVVLDPVDIHRIPNPCVRRVLYQVAQCTRLVIHVVQTLEGPDRVSAEILHGDEIARIGGARALRPRQDEDAHDEHTHQRSHAHLEPLSGQDRRLALAATIELAWAIAGGRRCVA